MLFDNNRLTLSLFFNIRKIVNENLARKGRQNNELAKTAMK